MLIGGSGSASMDVYGNTLQTYGYSSKFMFQPAIPEITFEIAYNNIFCFEGHAGPSEILLNDALGVNSRLLSSTIREIPRRRNWPYKFVFLNGCYSLSSEWKEAFGSECLLGWDGNVQAPAPSAFATELFWPETANYTNARAAFAYVMQQEWFKWYTGDPERSKLVGDSLPGMLGDTVWQPEQ